MPCEDRTRHSLIVSEAGMETAISPQCLRISALANRELQADFLSCFDSYSTRIVEVAFLSGGATRGFVNHVEKIGVFGRGPLSGKSENIRERGMERGSTGIVHA